MYQPSRSARRLAGVTALACAAALSPAALSPAAGAMAATAAPAASAASAASALSSAAPAATAVPVVPAVRPPACVTADLVIWLTMDGAAAGSAFYTLNFTNLSGHACTLRGHPAVWAVSLVGHRLGSPATAAGSRARTVTLARDATAYALLQYSDVVTGGGGPRPCHAVVAAGLRVRPPGQARAKTVPIPLTACTTAGLEYLTVRPVQKTAPPA